MMLNDLLLDCRPHQRIADELLSHVMLTAMQVGRLCQPISNWSDTELLLYTDYYF